MCENFIWQKLRVFRHFRSKLSSLFKIEIRESKLSPFVQINAKVWTCYLESLYNGENYKNLTQQFIAWLLTSWLISQLWPKSNCLTTPLLAHMTWMKSTIHQINTWTVRISIIPISWVLVGKLELASRVLPVVGKILNHNLHTIRYLEPGKKLTSFPCIVDSQTFLMRFWPQQYVAFLFTLSTEIVRKLWVTWKRISLVQSLENSIFRPPKFQKLLGSITVPKAFRYFALRWSWASDHNPKFVKHCTAYHWQPMDVLDLENCIQ